MGENFPKSTNPGVRFAAPTEPAGVGGFLSAEGQWWQVREYFVHRSIYHHKEADPYAWAIPRLRGQAVGSRSNCRGGRPLAPLVGAHQLGAAQQVTLHLALQALPGRLLEIGQDRVQRMELEEVLQILRR